MKVIFKVFGGDTEAQKTTTTTTTTTTSTFSPPLTRAPPRIDWESPGSSWRNHHNDEPYGEHINRNEYGIRINHAHPSTQRPVYINNNNEHGLYGRGAAINGGGGISINKPTKKTSELKFNGFFIFKANFCF